MSAGALTLVNTRPRGTSEGWTPVLEAGGWNVLHLPLIDIARPLDPEPVREMWRDPSRWSAWMFVSAAAVSHFFSLRPAPSPGEPAPVSVVGLPSVWATGPGTAAALLAAGVAACRIEQPRPDSLQFDSEALWEQVSPMVRANDRVCIVRGGDAEGRAAGRDWLVQQLLSRGVRVDTVVAYRRVQPSWSPATVLRARGAADAVWVFASSQALEHLSALCPGQDWSDATAIASHPRIAEVAQRRGFGTVICVRPGLEPLRAALAGLKGRA